MYDNTENFKVINKEFMWISQLLKLRIESYFSGDNTKYIEISPQELKNSDTHYARYLSKYALTLEERKILVMALACELKSNIYDIFFTKNELYAMPYTEFGGIQNHGAIGFIPTIQTALFLLSGENVEKKLPYIKIFDTCEKLYKYNILEKNFADGDKSLINSQLSLTKSSLSYLLNGRDILYEYSLDFPAVHLDTLYEWDDLVLTPHTRQQLIELEAWLKHGKTLMHDWNMQKTIKPGYRSLFYGPPGTGKTLTTTLLGKRTNRDVYRIDLSQLVSKYIGETEKNLEKIFRRAEQKEWILFFDEADALFGKRTSISNSNDKYANQETSYLLQRIEDFPNVVILASNLKENLDDAFTRRFQSIIYFQMPTKKERLKLWQNGFSKKSILARNIDLDSIADKYELSGGAIMNAIRYSSLMALNRGTNEISKDELIAGINREYYKEGKII
jgi:hypothetical protein